MAGIRSCIDSGRARALALAATLLLGACGGGARDVHVCPAPGTAGIENVRVGEYDRGTGLLTIVGLDGRGDVVARGQTRVDQGTPCVCLAPIANSSACRGLTCDFNQACTFRVTQADGGTGGEAGAETTVTLGENAGDEHQSTTTDTYLWPMQATMPLGTLGYLTTDADPNLPNYNNRRIMLVRFDLAALPAGVTIDRADLWLTVADDGVDPEPDNAGTDDSIEIFQASQSWLEESATWDSRGGALGAWSSPGAPGPVAVATFTPPIVKQMTYTVDVSVAARSWYADPGMNNGLTLYLCGGHLPCGSNAAVFVSSEGIDGSRPRLRVTYH